MYSYYSFPTYFSCVIKAIYNFCSYKYVRIVPVREQWNMRGFAQRLSMRVPSAIHKQELFFE